MTLLLDKIALFASLQGLGAPARQLLVAVSGGRDSMVLLDAVAKMGYAGAVAHCNFQLRGEESTQDARFVAEAAERYALPLHTVCFETAEYAATYKTSIQLAARALRYAWFEEILDKTGLLYVATAHHLNDNIETILHRLARGTGIKGLQGIPPVKGRVIRPLLQAAQAEIAQYAGENGLTWREDSSNALDKYTRNKIRHHLVPFFEEINPNFVHTFAQNIARFQGYALDLQARTAQWQEKLLISRSTHSIFHFQPLVGEVSGEIFFGDILAKFGFMYEQAMLIWQKCLEKATGALFYSPTYSLAIEGAQIALKPLASLPTEGIYTLEKGETCLQTPDFVLLVGEAEAVPTISALEVLLDAGKLAYPLACRRWRAGDSFRPLGMGGKQKKVADFLNDQKVARNLKSDVWVMESAGEIIWVMGYRIAETAKITAETQQKLAFSLRLKALPTARNQ